MKSGVCVYYLVCNCVVTVVVVKQPKEWRTINESNTDSITLRVMPNFSQGLERYNHN